MLGEIGGSCASVPPPEWAGKQAILFKIELPTLWSESVVQYFT